MISPHFDRREFACNCGCGLDTIDADTLMLCEVVRHIEGGPALVSSGHRCETYNRAVGGARDSMHLRGRAADLIVTKPRFVYDELCRLFPDRFGFGVYETWIHVDSRSVKARWTK